ncbi:MAG: DUF3883 domain-containing protein, partial [Thermoplasmata archaeon]|nr:DUF3883 domain-containing protein [Thermoplasmata archaeon]
VIIKQNTPVALAYVTPLPENYTADVESVVQVDTSRLKRDSEVEKAAVEFVTKWELEHGAATVKSRELDGVGYDLESYDVSHNLIRFIEVKGKTTEHDGILTPNEWSAAERLGKDYWLYVVENPKTKPDLLRVRDPFNTIKATPEIKVQRLFFQMAEIREKAAHLKGDKS